MAKIKVLDEHIANQIAAGEVVERPASVVKELVENAIDAGATKVDVWTEEGGLSSIRVTDNGSGIEPEDCETAFYRHATSKIAGGRDLFQITSLGFRGEALPSIASVAKVEVLTACGDDGAGRRLVIEGGTLKSNEDAPASRGTDFRVRELFYNTPARLKYMKTVQTELGHISDYMYRMALSHPEVAFTLRHNGNSLLQTLGGGDLLQVIAAVYGTTSAKAMLPLESENLDFAVNGFVSLPDFTRSNRSAVTTVVNGRYIRSHVLNQAIMRAYHTLLPVGRHPLVVLRLAMHPSLVDVNVHPAKLEVRFSKEAELIAFVEEAIRAALSREVLIPKAVNQRVGKSNTIVQEQFHFPKRENLQEELAAGLPPQSKDVPAGPPGTASGGSGPAERPGGDAAGTALVGGVSGGLPGTAGAGASGADAPGIPAQETGAPGEARPSGAAAGAAAAGIPAARVAAAGAGSAAYPAGGARSGLPQQVREPGHGAGYEGAAAGTYGGRGKREPAQPDRAGSAAAAARAAGVLYTPSEAPQRPAFPEMTLIGQHHGTYLIAQNDQGLYLIDQHAAHERINYEYYYEKFGQPETASQELLLPITLEFTSAESAKIRDRIGWFEQAGVYMEPFGGQTFRVTAYPHWFPAGDEASIIQEMADWVLSERAIDLAKLREKASTLCSCKASIKANQRLSDVQAQTLIERLGQCKQPYTCPHGRPIVVSFSSYDLEKLFKRVM
ncbi:DNA mismatch repair endonuclease MutL [Saccharibacillus sp. CPCC 101409]|uniref:DNA mismatch repair endonuclease MutL n=1 Tax=Saccharibacillus sp. CPCC 101409 TaxID=3058041 RepID=UPI0026730035|nr:DNA mismatch repair endonuclease MutL [Saccharibacillus sp. CPCC 101409]MDO3412814.1 DNA mismatch repair endonuclease MutL [Saccharibacillus sp. CPCC 101409]